LENEISAQKRKPMPAKATVSQNGISHAAGEVVILPKMKSPENENCQNRKSSAAQTRSCHEGMLLYKFEVLWEKSRAEMRPTPMRNGKNSSETENRPKKNRPDAPLS